MRLDEHLIGQYYIVNRPVNVACVRTDLWDKIPVDFELETTRVLRVLPLL